MKLPLLLALPALVAGCASVPPAPLVANPLAAGNSSFTRTYVPATGGYVSRRPVEPSDWRSMNERVAPGGTAR
ncbi:hypothetical protein [Lutibaculum baratangense]|uniref:hypothetical protein n=1 Tax=Lutibaculum baratangense TaxID=1358440 RepID=UPI00058F956F|nr:hypothetical protein [Lutibaculum baratangense]